ncbi:MAG TPA: hypothetical protein VIB39_08725 [Candidatus Angelobacter sp.]|jgi:hypothetical protein
MSSLSPDPRFEYRSAGGMTQAYCQACGLFVGASTRADTLRLAEEAHICPAKGWDCPACQQKLFLPKHLKEMPMILAARVLCIQCGKTIIISGNVPTVDETA